MNCYSAFYEAWVFLKGGKYIPLGACLSVVRVGRSCRSCVSVVRVGHARRSGVQVERAGRACRLGLLVRSSVKLVGKLVVLLVCYGKLFR